MKYDEENAVTISVIIPVYNKEKYLRDLCEDLMRQSFSDFEVLLVDNNSTDGSAEIMKKFAERDVRFRLLFEKTQGVSAARNRGLKEARGDFVVFPDADDRMQRGYLNVLLSAIEPEDGGKQAVDLSCCGYKTFYDRECLYMSPERTIRLLEVEDMLCRLFYTTHYQGFIWNKMFRREIIEKANIRFSEKIWYNEDRLFLVSYLCHAKNGVRMVPNRSYRYEIRFDSAQAESSLRTDSADNGSGADGADENGSATGKVGLNMETEKRLTTELLAFRKMRRKLLFHSDARWLCSQDMAYSELRIFIKMLTNDKEERYAYKKHPLRTYARRAFLLRYLCDGEKEESLYKKLIFYGWTGDSFTPHPEWFFEGEDSLEGRF